MAKSVEEVARFFGLVVSFCSDDHLPPHFHARYNGREAKVEIGTGNVIGGSLPTRQLKFILAWEELHRDELMERWEAVRAGLPLTPIAPLR